MADPSDPEPSSSTDLLSANSGSRESSGLQDILAVSAKMKERDDSGPIEGEPETAADSGRIVFGASDLATPDDEEEGTPTFMSFAGGLGSGGISIEPFADPDLAIFGGEGKPNLVPAPPKPAPVEEKRSPIGPIIVVLGLAVVGVAAVWFTQDPPAPPPTQAKANTEPEMTAKPPEPATVAGVGDRDTSAASGVLPQPDPDELATETGETEGVFIDTSTEGDPLAQTGDLLAAGGGVKKPGKSGGGSDKPGATTAADPEADDTGDLEAADPLPVPKKTGGGGGGEASQDEVDCLLNPDLAKCGQGGGGGGNDGPVLVPKVPEKLDSAALKTGFNSVKSKAKACGAKHGAEAGSKVKIHASIEGATGTVTSVEALGEHAGTELGKCVEDAVENATFEKFKSPAQGVDYSMVM